MRDPRDAVAFGQLSRARILLAERRTELAYRLLGDIRVVQNAAPLSLEARLRAHHELSRARALARRGTAEEVGAARAILDLLVQSVRPDVVALGAGTRAGDVAKLAADGEAGANLLNDIAIVYGIVGRHRDAISIAEQLLALARKRKQRAMEVVQLNNLAQRRMRLGYLSSCQGDETGARLHLERAADEHRECLGKRRQDDDPVAEASRMLSEAGLLRAKLELAVIPSDAVASRGEELSRLSHGAKQLLRRSYDNAVVTPTSRLIRADLYGMLELERARAVATRGDHDGAREIAMLARCLMKPRYDGFVGDVDRPAALSVRYGDACAISGSVAIAREVYLRALERNTLIHPNGTGADRRIRERLAELSGITRRRTAD